MPMWFYGGFSKMIWPPSGREEVEIAHGDITTDAKGEFKIVFKALPDNSVAKKDQPTFYYEVTAYVTDIAGETRSGNTQVAVAYQALKLTMGVPEKIHADSLKNIKLSSTNLNDVFEKTTVTVSAHKLKTPGRTFRHRLWPQPDQFVLSQQEFYGLFPYDVYKDENDPSKWAKDQKVWEKTDTTSNKKLFTVDHSSFTPGWYVIEAVTKDKYGSAVKEVAYVQLFNQTIESALADGSIESSKTTLEPGDKATYQVSATVDNAFVIHEVIKKDNTSDRSFFTLSKNSRSFELPVAEKDRGGFGIQMAFVKNNRVYSDALTFSVPYTNKELTIAYETFRDKTLPGSEEKWKVKISGYKGEKVVAEMLTAMYDASLDQFKPHNWEKPSLLNYFGMGGTWDGGLNFSHVQSLEKYNPIELYTSITKNYDELGLPFGGLSGGGDIRIRGMKSLAKSAAPGAAPEVAMAAGVGDQNKLAVSDEAANMKPPAIIKEDTFVQPGEMYVDGKLIKKDDPAVQIRKNFNETAFFFPDLHTDANGSIEFSFTMPEAVTQWKWMSLAHTKDLSFGYDEKTIVTQKDLMVQPNAPRFLREGDHMNFSGKIANLTDKEITGQVQLLLIDATTNQPVDGWFHNVMPNQFFTVAAKQSAPVSFSIEIPYQYNKPVTYRLIAKAGNISDG
ncbi:MAG TPA: alpha-2-macroglobulin family protein, partial [Niastella sp.]